MMENKKENKTPEFININGQRIRKDTIVTVGEVQEGADIVHPIIHRPKGWYYFDISLDTGETKTFHYFFSLKYFGGKPKNQSKKDTAHTNATRLRNFVLKELESEESKADLFRKQSEGRMNRKEQKIPVVTDISNSDDPVEQIVELFDGLNFHTQREVLDKLLKF